MNKRCVVLEELKKGAEPFEALEAATQYYINVIMGETMPIGGADVPGLLTAVRLIDKTISEDNPEAARGLWTSSRCTGAGVDMRLGH